MIGRTILSDAELDRELKFNGFVIVNLLSQENVRELVNFYMQNPGPKDMNFHATHFSNDRSYKKIVHEILVALLGPLLSPMLEDYTPVFGNFMVKEGNCPESMPLHADWTYVDERFNRSIAVWTPLVDTTSDNGSLGVIPGSHLLTNQIRGPRIRQWTEPVNELLIRRAGEILCLKAGQAVIYDHGLLHYSLPNLTENIRPAINLSLAPRNTPLIHYAVPEGQELLHRFVASDSEFFLNYDHFQMPESGQKVQVTRMDIPLLNSKAIGFLRENGKMDSLDYLQWLSFQMLRKMNAQFKSA